MLTVVESGFDRLPLARRLDTELLVEAVPRSLGR
jgi:hypothetical protein